MQTKSKVRLFLCLAFCFCVANCEDQVEAPKDLGADLIEQGRTFVHGTLKRFMILAPAIFFKLGIAFTLLLIVTLVAANNGFIGFLILVVGLSSVLSRLQGRPSPPVVQPLPLSYAAVPQLAHHHHPWIDRSDNMDAMQKASKVVNGFYAQNYGSNADMRNTGVYYKEFN